MVKEQAEEKAKKKEKNDCKRYRDEEEVGAPDQEGLGALMRKAGRAKAIGRVGTLVVDLPEEGGVGHAKQLEDFTIPKEAPLHVLDGAELAEELAHDAAVVAIVEGVKVEVVEGGEEVEGRRDAAQRRHRHHDLGAVEHAGNELLKAFQEGKHRGKGRGLSFGREGRDTT